MKQILISIKPKWVAKILRGEKTLEIRKTAPKELPCEVFIYCTKNGEQISRGTLRGVLKPLNGKVVAKFTLNKVDKFFYFDDDEICVPACLDRGSVLDYLGDNDGYAWHISDLEIFNDPKDLEKFDYPNPSGIANVSQSSIKGLPNKKHPPQSWCYVEELL